MLSAIYGKIMTLRNTLYDKGVFDVHNLGVRTISVGNITAGGTGKTPLVAYVSEVLAARDEKVCILTRGYGRENPKQRVLVSDGEQVLVDARTGGDEPVELANKLLGKAIVIADADRVAAAEWALRKFGVTVFVLDDGFQHRKVKRDLDIVCVDATNPFGGGKNLPFGRLREPLAGLARAHCFVITRSDLVDDITDLKARLVERNSSATVFYAKNVIHSISPIETFHAKTQTGQKAKIGGSAFAFCGLGNPENFFDLLRRQKTVAVVDCKAFVDHHFYTQSDVTRIEAAARSSGADMLLTTAKDATKLSDLRVASRNTGKSFLPEFEFPCFVVKIETKIDDKDAFDAML